MLAGLIVVVSTPGWALAVDAATFGVSAASLALLHLPAHVRPPRRRFLHDLADGWREFSLAHLGLGDGRRRRCAREPVLRVLAVLAPGDCEGASSAAPASIR